MQTLQQSELDKKLVKLAQEGDQNALNNLLAIHRPMIFSVAMTIFRNKPDAEDAAQEIMLRVQKKLSSYRGDSSFVSWLYPVAHNLCIDRVKQKNSYDKKTVQLDDENGKENVEDFNIAFKRVTSKYDREESFSKTARVRIQDALEALSEKHRQIILMREVDGMTYEQMAKILNVELGTIMSRLSNAREYFEHNLKSCGVTAETLFKLGDE